jgi:hypothetical protein
MLVYTIVAMPMFSGSLKRIGRIKGVLLFTW